MKKLFILPILTLALFTSAVPRDAHAADKPNVIIIYGDDVGFGDVGVNGSKKIPTPNIDKLAAEGLNFTDGHCPASTCSASRYAMLTGEFAHRKGIRVLGPTSAMPITTDQYTLPRVFKDAGYATAVVGKWHLGLGSKESPADYNQAVKPGPLEIGFDYSFLLPNTNDRVPCVYLENHHVPNLDPKDPISLNKPLEGVKQTVYPDARETPEAMTYYPSSHGHNNTVINGIGRIGQMWGGKSALWDDETMSDVFVERTSAWMKKHVMKNPDQPFFLYFCSQDIHVPRTPHPRFHGKSELGFRGDAMVSFDWVTGEIMAMLDKHGIADDTMIIFSSDNGPVYDDGYNDGTTVKTSTEEADRGHDGSGPYRGGKYQIYEGGTRVPFIVRWPARIKPGTTNALVSHIDFISSFASHLGVEVPEGQAPDSQDAFAALIGEDKKGNAYLVEEAGGWGLRSGDWKLVRPNPKKGGKGKPKLDNFGKPMKVRVEPHRYELYNLSDDIGEQNNIASENPEVLKELSDLLEKIVNGAPARETFGAN